MIIAEHNTPNAAELIAENSEELDREMAENCVKKK